MPFRIVRNDITCMQVDAIVNTANPMPIYSNGTDRAIYEKAGAEKLLKKRAKIGVLQPGEAAVTPGFDLPARYIIHAVSPIWQGGQKQEEKLLRLCYRNVLELARKKHCKSIAFPLLAAGSNGFPKASALTIALDSFREFLWENDMEIILTVFDKEALILSEKLTGDIESYIDDHYVEERHVQEYPGLRNGRGEHNRADASFNEPTEESIDIRFDASFTEPTEERSDENYQTESLDEIRPRPSRPSGSFHNSLNFIRGLGAKAKRSEEASETLDVFDELDAAPLDAAPLEADSLKDALLSEEALEDTVEDTLMKSSSFKPDSLDDVFLKDSVLKDDHHEASSQTMQSFEAESEPSYQRMYQASPSMEPSTMAPSTIMEPSMVALQFREKSEKKDTHAPKIRLGKNLDELLQNREDTFQQYMLQLIKTKGLKNVDVYTRANMDRKLFSKIKSNENYNPKKNTALALCIGLMLDFSEAEKLLARAGYAFSPSSKVDLIVRYFIEHQAYDVMTIDTVLYDHDLPMLSSYS